MYKTIQYSTIQYCERNTFYSNYSTVHRGTLPFCSSKFKYSSTIHNTVQYSIQYIQYITKYIAVQYDCSVLRTSTLTVRALSQCISTKLRYNPLHRNILQYNTIQYSIVYSSRVQYTVSKTTHTVQYSIA